MSSTSSSSEATSTPSPSEDNSSDGKDGGSAGQKFSEWIQKKREAAALFDLTSPQQSSDSLLVTLGFGSAIYRYSTYLAVHSSAAIKAPVRQKLTTYSVGAVTLVIRTLRVYGRPEDSVTREAVATLRNELADYMALAKTKEQQRCLKDLMQGAKEDLEKMKEEYDAQKQMEEENVPESTTTTESSLTSSTPSSSETATSSPSEAPTTPSSSETSSTSSSPEAPTTAGSTETSSTSSSPEALSTTSSSEDTSSDGQDGGSTEQKNEDKLAKYNMFLEWIKQKREAAANVLTVRYCYSSVCGRHVRRPTVRPAGVTVYIPRTPPPQSSKYRRCRNVAEIPPLDLVYGRPGNMMQYEGAAFLRHELARFMSLAQTRDQRECLQDVMRGANEELDRMEQEYDTQNMEEEEKLHKSAKYAAHISITAKDGD
ncbi:hypothetical protein AAG570_002804 [Ranatra chinensis]|uniref:Uncharacterized protein n=1 Tax=Ranatra chinensis TaxID=642074 RepID=A0ABD0YMX6_9HEMI